MWSPTSFYLNTSFSPILNLVGHHYIQFSYLFNLLKNNIYLSMFFIGRVIWKLFHGAIRGFLISLLEWVSMCIYAIPSWEVTYLSYVGHLILDIKHYPNLCFKIFIIDETCDYNFLKCCNNSITMKCYHIHSELVSHIHWMVTTYFWIFSIFQKYYHIFHQWQKNF